MHHCQVFQSRPAIWGLEIIACGTFAISRTKVQRQLRKHDFFAFSSKISL
jgi:hypothetical protein